MASENTLFLGGVIVYFAKIYQKLIPQQGNGLLGFIAYLLRIRDFLREITGKYHLQVLVYHVVRRGLLSSGVWAHFNPGKVLIQEFILSD